MRISDWSSDVCSSDLTLIVEHIDARRAANRLGDILIGELADRIAGKDGLDRAGRALPRNRARQIGALTDDEDRVGRIRSEEHTSELQSLMRISYAVFCLKKKKKKKKKKNKEQPE